MLSMGGGSRLFRSFFDHIDHGWMVRMLEERIADRKLIRLIVKWLKAGILEEDGRTVHPATGTPQGGVICFAPAPRRSPLRGSLRLAMTLRSILPYWPR